MTVHPIVSLSLIIVAAALVVIGILSPMHWVFGLGFLLFGYTAIASLKQWKPAK